MPDVRRNFFPFLFFFLALSVSNGFAKENVFAIEDYFKFNRITELALSSDGEMIAYAVETKSLDQNKAIHRVFIKAVTPGAAPIEIDSIQNARDFAWIPGAHELAYLMSDDGVTEVFSIDPKTKKTRQHTSGEAAVTAFRFAPDGSTLAWTRQSNDKSPSLYERLFDGDDGVVIDSEYTIVYQFVNPEWGDAAARPSNELWLKLMPSGKARRIRPPGKVKSFYWSSDATLLSISYVADDVPRIAYSETFTSLGVFDLTNDTFNELARARSPSEKGDALYYSGGDWIPGKNKLIVRRSMAYDRWTRKAEWSIFDLSGNSPAPPGMSAWRPIEMYRPDPEPAFLPVDERLIYSEKTVRAHPYLYEVGSFEIRRAEILEDVAGAVSHVGFSADFETAAFVNEDLDRPPEIYLWRKERGVTQLTQLNNAIADKQLPRVREITWRSKDGVSVQGWLLEPADDSDKPWPLITFVHGGPGVAYPNQFAFYFTMYGGGWPYAFNVYALNGMAVFIPNYRGTATFGFDFKSPDAIDKEPADDIISGVDYLIAAGIADPQRLAISGQSHGVWLAALVMTKAKDFLTASLAEGNLNKFVNYSLMPGWLNRETHDIQYGASLDDDPARFMELSPDMQFRGLHTAVLFEAGAKSLAVIMMGSPKAAKRAGMPAEFVVYPKTGHGVQIPRLQEESAHRNLDWFRFWLQGYEDPDTQKQEQYVRWRNMRDAQCAQPSKEADLWYCRQ